MCKMLPQGPVSKQRVDTPKVGGVHNATEDKFVMQCTPLPRQPRRETPRRRAERGTPPKEAEAPLAGYSRKVTPLAFIHRRVRPLDGWMVVANPYHLIKDSQRCL